MLVVSKVSKAFRPYQYPHIGNLFLLKKKQLTAACRDISFQLSKGELLGVVGPNGSGKTTLLRLIAGTVIADQGLIMVDGLDSIRQSLEVRRILRIVFSHHGSFYLRLTGEENLQLFAAFYGLSNKEAEVRIGELADLFEIRQYLGKMFQENSSGIKQRFALARGFLSEGSLFLLDEPTKNLDPEMAGKVKAYIRKELVEKKKKTVVMTSHLLSEVREIADRLAILDEGTMKAFGTWQELERGLPHKTMNPDEVYAHYLKDKDNG